MPSSRCVCGIIASLQCRNASTNGCHVCLRENKSLNVSQLSAQPNNEFFSGCFISPRAAEMSALHLPRVRTRDCQKCTAVGANRTHAQKSQTDDSTVQSLSADTGSAWPQIKSLLREVKLGYSTGSCVSLDRRSLRAPVHVPSKPQCYVWQLVDFHNKGTTNNE